MRRYKRLVIILLVITAVMSIKDMAIAVVMLTFGLGFPLVFSATALLYALCAYPAVAAWPRDRAARVMGAAISICVAGAVALLPGFFGQIRAAQIETALSAKDHKPVSPLLATSIEIRRPPDSYDKTFLDREPCGVECRSILINGQVEWVRVVMVNPGRKPAASTSTFYRRYDHATCNVPGKNSTAAQPCVLMSPDLGGRADLVMTIPPFETVSRGKSGFALIGTVKSRAVTVTRMVQQAKSEVLRQTEVKIDVTATPSIAGPKFSGMSSGGLELAKSVKHFNPITLSGALGALGLNSAPPAGADVPPSKPRDWKDSITDGMTRELIAVLDLPGAAVFNQQQNQVISTWIMHARQVKDWTPELIAVLRRIVTDPRLRATSFFDQIFERQPVVTRALLPDVLAILERDGVTQDHTPARQAAYTFNRISPEILKPYASRITGLISKDGDLPAILLPAVGRLGLDPLPYLQPFDADLNPKQPKYSKGFTRLKGACFAEAQWTPQLISELKAALAASQGQSRREQEFRRAVLSTIANLGDKAFAVHELESGRHGDGKRLQRILISLDNRRRAANSLCFSSY